MRVELRVHGATDVGCVREQNEDALLVDQHRSIFAVADGLGGLPGGEVASRTAIGALQQQLRELGDQPPDLKKLVLQAHTAVQEAGVPYGATGIGTTLTLARVANDVAHIAHVGDSFALLLRAGTCRPLTREHNIENERTDVFALAPHPPNYRYALTRVLGQPEDFQPDVFTEQLEVGDRLILATDGLTDMIDFSEIAALASPDDPPAAIAEKLVAAAIEAGGRDNITLIVIGVDAE